jgi:hypothetical protein
MPTTWSPGASSSLFDATTTAVVPARITSPSPTGGT